MTNGARQIDIVAPRGLTLRWHKKLRERLSQVFAECEVTLRQSETVARWPEGVSSVLALERLLLRRGRPALSDPLTEPCPSLRVEAPDIIIDLAGELPPTAAGRVLRPLFDGELSDAQAIAALLSGRAPSLELVDIGANAIVARGLPTLEAMNGLADGLDAVYSRLALLIEGALASPGYSVGAVAAVRRHPAPSVTRFVLRDIARRCIRAIYLLCCRSPHWRVGWRFVDGPDLIDSGAHTPPWRIMADRETSFAADPFPWEWRGIRGVFYEGFDYRTNKGDIHFQRFDANGPVGEPTLAIEEPWHLSYPFLMEHGGELYMLPEASASNAVTLYRCVEFPNRWEPVAKLIDGVEAADATIFRHNGRYWMTSVVREGVGGYSDTLAIHHAANPLGPWEEHAQRPVLIDARYARPAGAVVTRGGNLLRPAQDCADGYGLGVYVMRIDELTPENFKQTPLRRIGAGPGWPGKRLHTINRAGRLECIDGVIITPKLGPVRRIAHAVIDRGSPVSLEALAT